MPPDEPTDEEKQQLPQDNGTPFQPAAPNPDPAGASDPLTQAPSGSALDDTHPATDTGVQPEESYDEGVSGAAEAREPNAGNAVTGFTPPPDDGTAPPPDQPIDDSSASGTGNGGVVAG